MSTRSSARNLFSPLDNLELTIRRRSHVDPTLLNDFEMATDENGDPPVPDLRTIEELCQPTLNGRGGPIAPIAIQAMNFGLKNDMIQQDQNSCQFHGLLGDDANKHPDKYLHLRNEITNFCQRPDESLFEAWERYKLSIDRCRNHNMLPVTQKDTFYNGLTLRHHDTINAAVGGTFMKRRPEECYDLIKNMTAHHNDWDTSAQWSESSSSINSSSDPKIVALKAEMAKINKNLMKILQINQQVKEVTPSCETCGGPHSYNDCTATVGQTQNVYVAGAYNQGGNYYQPHGNRNLLTYRSDNYLGPPGFNQNQNQNYQNQNRNQGNNHPQRNNQGRNQFFQGASHGQNPPPAYQAPVYQAPGYQPSIPQQKFVTTTEFTNYMKANDAILKNMQTNMTSLKNSNLELKNMFGQFIKMNTASSSGLGTPPSNTMDLKGITTRSGNAYQGPTILTTSSSLSKVVERETEEPKDMVPPTNNRSTKDVQPPVIQVETPIPNSEPVVAPVIEPVVALYELARTSLNEHCSSVLLKKLPEKLEDPGKFLIPCDFPGMDECLALADLDASINLMPLSVWNNLSIPELSPTCMTLELADRSISRPVGVAEDVFVKVGKFHFPADFVVVDFDADPRVPLILGISFLKTERALIDVYDGELTLRVNHEAVTFNLDQTSRYSANFDMTANRIDALIWLEKSHFMVKEGIVLGHKISKNGIEVDKAKVDVIAKLPHPTTVKGVVLGQRHEKHFRPIHYASKTMTEAESHYTTTEKEMLAVVYAYEKFWSYLIMNKSIMYMDQSALKYLFAKNDSKTRLLRWVLLLQEFKFKAYENSLIYKEKTKRLHDSKIKDRVFNVGDRVLLFNSRLKIFSGKLKTRWSRPFTITQVFSYGTVELSQTDGPYFKVNGHRLKHYFREDIPNMVVSDLQTFLKDQ
nr:reverse transcriptase domain-containing protein [Tanacetum cinerariifolium]